MPRFIAMMNIFDAYGKLMHEPGEILPYYTLPGQPQQPQCLTLCAQRKERHLNLSHRAIFIFGRPLIARDVCLSPRRGGRQGSYKQGEVFCQCFFTRRFDAPSPPAGAGAKRPLRRRRRAKVGMGGRGHRVSDRALQPFVTPTLALPRRGGGD